MTGWKCAGVGAIATVALFFTAHARAQPSPNPFRGLRPETVALPPPALPAGAQIEARFADRIFDLLQADDPALAAGAFELLEAAPVNAVDRLRPRLEEGKVLDRVLERAPAEIKGRFDNSRALTLGKLLNGAPDHFLSLFEAQLKSGNVTGLTWLASVGSGFRALPQPVGARIVSAIDEGKLKGQVLTEWTNLLLQYPADLAPFEKSFRSWLRATPQEGDEATKHRAALQALLGLGKQLDPAQVEAALHDGSSAVAGAALSYLRSPRGQDMKSDAIRDAAVRLLFDADTSAVNFRAVHALLSERWPQPMAATYNNSAGVLDKWPPGRSADWVALAQAGSAAAADLPLRHPAQKGAGSCDDLRFGLEVLKRRAALGRPVLGDFWSLVAATPHNCRPSSDRGEIDAVGTAIDELLATAMRQTGAETQLAALAAGGPGQLTDMQLRSARLGRALAPRMAQAVRAGDWKMARQFVEAGVRMDGEDLAAFWESAVPATGGGGLAADLYARLALAAGELPSAVAARLARLAGDDKANGEARAWALIALAASGNFVQLQPVFIQSMAAADPTLARTAMGILGRGYANGLQKKDFRDIDAGSLGDALTRGDDPFKKQSAALLAYLAPFGDRYARLFIENSTLDVPRRCAVLLPHPMSVAVGIAMLDAAGRAEGPAEDAGRACLAALVPQDDPLDSVVRNWKGAGAQPSPSVLLQQLRELWNHPSFAESGLAKKFVGIAAAAAPRLGYAGNGEILGWWVGAAKQHEPSLAERIQFEKSKRGVLLWLAGVPLVVLAHLALWAMLLSIYPHSASVQAVVFWNPLVRKLLGLGYIDLVLLYVPYARSRLFAPFKADFLRHVHGDGSPAGGQVAYYDASLVTRRDTRAGTQPQAGPPTTIVAALSSAKGRVLLLGKSGLGKSSFLRFWLSQAAQGARGVMVYLRADECRGGVEAEITRRMKAIGSDQSLLRAMLYAGRLNVYIDGYNEVDLKTQDEITAFLGDYPRGNILVTSQIPLRGFTSIDTYELMPLSRAQTREFLGSRVAVIPAQSPVQGAVFVKIAEGFLDDTWAKAGGDEDAKAFDEILSNPMDLTSIAMLLAGGSVPDLFALENQQFEAVKARMSSQQQLQFRTEAFSRAVLHQRLDDQEDLLVLAFKPEVAELLHAKLAQNRTFADPASKMVVQEIRFRHDRIRDYFTHFALLSMGPGEVAEKAADARFAGVFKYLARAMPAAVAEDVRERLIRLAADMEDHRVSDSFIREYGWRQRLAPQDPPWLLEYDLPDGKQAEVQIEAAQGEKRQLDARIAGLCERLARARHHARLLTCGDSQALALLARDALQALGAQALEGGDSAGTFALLRSPAGTVFALNAVAHPERLRDFHVALVAGRMEDCRHPVVLLVNSQVAFPPQERTADLTRESVQTLRRAGAVVVTAAQLYAAYFDSCDGGPGQAAGFWAQLESGWSPHPPRATHPEVNA